MPYRQSLSNLPSAALELFENGISFNHSQGSDARVGIDAMSGSKGSQAAEALEIHASTPMDTVWNEDTPLSERDLAKLQKTAEMEGIDITAARKLQKGYRYII